MEGVTTDVWTQRQVDRHASHTIGELLQIWRETVQTFSDILPNIPQPLISQFVFDQVTHEQDIRHAISEKGARDSLAIKVADGFIRDSLSHNSELEIMELASHRISGFEFVRSLSGRRTLTQIAATGLPANVVEFFIKNTPFTLPKVSVIE